MRWLRWRKLASMLMSLHLTIASGWQRHRLSNVWIWCSWSSQMSWAYAQMHRVPSLSLQSFAFRSCSLGTCQALDASGLAMAQWASLLWIHVLAYGRSHVQEDEGLSQTTYSALLKWLLCWCPCQQLFLMCFHFDHSLLAFSFWFYIMQHGAYSVSNAMHVQLMNPCSAIMPTCSPLWPNLKMNSDAERIKQKLLSSFIIFMSYMQICP